jgi:hypothetical protein
MLSIYYDYLNENYTCVTDLQQSNAFIFILSSMICSWSYMSSKKSTLKTSLIKMGKQLTKVKSRTCITCENKYSHMTQIIKTIFA